jgi:hypothetical protein
MRAKRIENKRLERFPEDVFYSETTSLNDLKSEQQFFLFNKRIITKDSRNKGTLVKRIIERLEKLSISKEKINLSSK